MAEFHVGPVTGSTARSWLASARRVLAWMRADAARAAEVPAEVGADFDTLLDEWDEAARGEIFDWRGTVDDAQLPRLLSYWYRTAAVVLAHAREPGTPLPPPETEPFRLAVAAAASALAEQGVDTEQFGATFRDAWAVPAQRGAMEDRTAAAGLPRVIVVDDSDDMRLLLRTAIELDGRFEWAGEAVDGAAAIEICDKEHPDLVVLDLRMPGMDGYTALPHIRAGCPSAAIVVFSAEAAESVEERVLELGANGVITKGMPIPDLLTALIHAFSSSH